MNTVEKITEYGIIPRIHTANDSIVAARALVDASLPIIELSLDRASDVAKIKKEFPAMTVGLRGIACCGCVATGAAAGADYMRTKALTKEVADAIKKSGAVAIADIDEADGIKRAADAGFDMISVSLDGLSDDSAEKLVAALAKDAPDAKIIFKGEDGLKYLHATNAAAYINPEMCDGDDIGTAAKAEMFKMFGFNLAHIGINGENEAEAIRIADLYSNLLGLNTKVGNSSVFSGKIVEVMKTPFLGKNGHIAIGSREMSRAVAYFRRVGMKFNEDTAKFKPDGKPVAIYFADDFGGFAIHLLNTK